MKRYLLLFVLLPAMAFSLAQSPSKKMIELQKICLDLRNNIGSEQVVSSAIKQYQRFMIENAFSSDFSQFNREWISGSDNMLTETKESHVFFIPEYFTKLLETSDGLFDKHEELLAEWRELISYNSRAISGYIFYQDNIIIRKGKSITFELTIPKGPFDIMAIAEPNAFLTLRIQDCSSGQFYITEKDVTAHKWFNFEKTTKLRITIENTSRKNASIALFCF